MKRRRSPLTFLSGGRRAGSLFLVCGALCALAAGVLVMRLGRQTGVAAAETVPQIYVVMATRDIPEHTTIRADALSVKPFPAAFAPPGAASKVEDVAGKFATARITRDQIVLSTQASETKRTSNLSASIPPGKVAFWMPMPDLLAQSGGLQAGDRVDVLLSVPLTEMKAGSSGSSGATESAKGLTTQSTLQNVEVFFVGAATNVETESIAPAAGQRGALPGSGAAPSRVVVFLLDPQDAVLAKFIKDSGGTIDLVLRSDTGADVAATESVTADTLIDRFKFRVPDRWSTTAGR